MELGIVYKPATLSRSLNTLIITEYKKGTNNHRIFFEFFIGCSTWLTINRKIKTGKINAHSILSIKRRRGKVSYISTISKTRLSKRRESVNMA
jgi:hypothetical protein